MTSPITEPKKARKAKQVQARTWCCGTPVTEPHIEGCAYEPREENPVDYNAPVEIVEPEPPAPTLSEPAASSMSEDKPYGFKRPKEFDIELSSGAKVRVRRLRKMQIVDMGIADMFDGFGPELLKGLTDGGQQAVAEAEAEVIRDPQKRAKVFGPLNRIVMAATLRPTIVDDGPTDDAQWNVDEIEPEDKWEIFAAAMPDELQTAALEAQRNALKSVHRSQESI